MQTPAGRGAHEQRFCFGGSGAGSVSFGSIVTTHLPPVFKQSISAADCFGQLQPGKHAPMRCANNSTHSNISIRRTKSSFTRQRRSTQAFDSELTFLLRVGIRRHAARHRHWLLATRRHPRSAVRFARLLFSRTTIAFRRTHARAVLLLIGVVAMSINNNPTQNNNIFDRSFVRSFVLAANAFCWIGFLRDLTSRLTILCLFVESNVESFSQTKKTRLSKQSRNIIRSYQAAKYCGHTLLAH